jgi:hypothetical protein
MRGIILCVFLFFTCKTVPKEKSSIVLVNEVLHAEINKFDELITTKEDYVLVAFFHTKKDSVIVNLVESYPDFSRSRFQGIFFTPKKTMVIFLGDTGFNDFYKKRFEMKIPEKLITRSNKIRNNLEIISVEPKMLSLCFYNGVLIRSVGEFSTFSNE